MGGQVLDHADIADAGREGALAAGEDLVDLPQLPGVEPRSQGPQRRVAAFNVADGAHEPRPGEGLGHAPAGGGRMGDGLFHHGGHPGGGQGQGDPLVVDGGHRDHGRVQADPDEGGRIGQDGKIPGHAEPVAARVGHGHQLHACGGADETGVVAAHGPQADQTHAQIRQSRLEAHQEPALATAATASMMRSRSCRLRLGWTGSDRHSRAALSVPGSCASAP